MTQNKKIAITGGIGSGKSAFSSLLRGMGLPVLSCDEINAQLLSDAEYLAALGLRFPECVKDGTLDKEALSARVFSDQNELAALEAIAHPIIMRRLIGKMNEYPVCFAEVPLLYEGGYETLFDAVVALRRSRSERLKAVRARDGLSDGQILARMAKQLNAEELEKKDCILVDNDGDLSALAQKAKAVLALLAAKFPDFSGYFQIKE